MGLVCNPLKPVVVLRADGSKLIGMGHLSRARLVANAFSAKGYEVRFLVKFNENAHNFLKTNNSYSVIFFPEDISLEAEFNLIHDTLPKFGGVLIIDVLNHLDYCPLFDKLRLNNCVSAVIFDDDDVSKINSDVALNGSLFHLNDEKISRFDRYLFGFRYFIMDPAYKFITIRPPPDHVKNIFLTLGGSDHNDLLFKLLNTFDAIGDRYRITIALSTASGYVDRLMLAVKNLGLQVELHLDSPSLVKFWEGSDLAITAGGNSLFERVASGLPGATICQLDLQMKHADSFERLGVNVNFGYGPFLSQDCLMEKLNIFLDDRSEHWRQYAKMFGLIDGDGLNHFIAAIELAKKRLK